MVSIICGQPQKEYMVKCAHVAIIFVIMRFQGSVMLKEHNF
jgi:hypothetical protein